MAHYQEVDYCSEEVRSVGAPPSGFLHHGSGAQQHRVVKESKSFQEVDNYGRAGGHHHRHHPHHGGGSDYLVVRETKVEEDVNTRTGEFHERKESFLYRAD
ncbi:hypothetical protein GUJ93_ZPchr0007g4264 [Zizania palustris]|uniref:Uncharacterized protein n=1 Tax=Zizania palustris TaxID=103762 RepID=A0A8J5W5W2_ZIZPA|nr:hypothetical protein GUJ93_ZPchr0007g4264 [Zizania palustris]